MSAPATAKVVLFCGGRGSATIIRALLRQPGVELTLLVNGYDDGLSTGALRNFIPGMLGPSDFRKNFSTLLGNYSNAQYALKSLMEYRLPASTGLADIEKLARFAQDGEIALLDEPAKSWFAQLAPPLSGRMRALLARFFAHAAGAPFDYRDCSLGNLVFAGAYLACDQDFDAAATEVGELVGTRARLLNVGGRQNRVLAGLKANGQILASEAEIVGPQSAERIRGLYLLEHPLSPADLDVLGALDTDDKAAWLAQRDCVPALSPAAAATLVEADIILYGPGTQHSSLLPSYRIAAEALKAAPAAVKALVMNLQSDNDIQGLTASDILDLAIGHGAVVTDVLENVDALPGRLPSIRSETARGARIVRGRFANPFRPQVHNGGLVVEQLLDLKAGGGARAPSVEIFADIHNRSAASDELIEEFLETDWDGTRVQLVLNRIVPADFGAAPIIQAQHGGLFPEDGYFREWLGRGGSDYLVLMTGDGAYRFRDVQNILRLLEQQDSLGGVFGSRTQSRRQFITSIQAAYGENRLLYFLGKVAAMVLSLLFYFRAGVIFSDPLTGLRVFRRQSLTGLPEIRATAPLALVRQLIRHGVEVAELPVLYRTYSGFTDPNWRMRRGLRNLFSLFT
jgi:2-phospho-L-lactate transferase/gluconeogenesis factor (CofD/UPF0052 family)